MAIPKDKLFQLLEEKEVEKENRRKAREARESKIFNLLAPGKETAAKVCPACGKPFN